MDVAVQAEFQPDSAEPRLLRDALGRFATGVTVVTCLSGGQPVGITANSFASVSLDPALVLWSFSTAQNFAIHILGADERDLAARFTRGGAGFDGLALTTGQAGTPLIDGTLARFDCALDRSLDGGDHVILLGRVLSASYRAGAPLVFSQGHFGGFAT